MVDKRKIQQDRCQNIRQPSNRAQAVTSFHVMDLLARARALESQGRSIIHMEVGEPDFATAQPVINAGIHALEQMKTHYTDATGLQELKQAIADYYQSEFGVSIHPSRVILTPGASGAIQLALSVVADAGDQILLSDPGYPCNRNIARVLGIETGIVTASSENNFQLDTASIQRHWTDRTRAAMVASPSNPTGTMISKQHMSSLIDTCDALGGHLIIDEIYQGLVYEEENYTALSYSDDVFVINSFSKYFGMTGWRLGWLVVPDNYIDAVERIAQNVYLAPSTLAQYAALEVFSSETRTIMSSRVEEFKQRRNYLVPALQALGFKIPQIPQGAFYIYADCSQLTSNSYEWCQQLLEKQGVAVTPGIDFGEYNASSYVRFAYTRPVEVLQQAVQRLSEFINDNNL